MLERFVEHSPDVADDERLRTTEGETETVEEEICILGVLYSRYARRFIASASIVRATALLQSSQKNHQRNRSIPAKPSSSRARLRRR